MPSKNNRQKEETTEDDVNLSELTYEERDAILLEMEAEEMMNKRAGTKKGISSPVKVKRKRKKLKSKKEPIAPGFGWVVIRMNSAMVFSMTFVFLGLIFIFAALFKAFGSLDVYDWQDLLFGLLGLVLWVAAYFLFRYVIKD